MQQILSSSLIVNQSITSSNLVGDGSGIINIQSASYAPTASAVLGDVEIQGFPYTGSANLSGSLAITGSFEILSIGSTQSSSTSTLVLDNSTVKQQPIVDYGTKGLQTTLNTMSDTSGLLNLDIQNYNGFSITPVGDTTIRFNTGSQQVYNINLIWENVITYDNVKNFNIQSASYDNTFYTSSQEETNPTSFIFNGNGSKMILVGNTSKTLHEYTLSVPFDIRTINYTSKTFDIGEQTVSPDSITVNPAGDRLFVLDSNSNSVFQYSFGIPFDISTLSYDNISTDISGQVIVPTSITFNNIGNKFYITSAGNTRIFEYELGTNFDLGNVTYNSVEKNISSEGPAPTSLKFNEDGTKLFTLDISADKIFKYNLSTAYNISTATYSGISLDIKTQSSNPIELVFGNNGLKSYILDSTTNTIHQFDTSDPSSFNIAKITDNGVSADLSSILNSPLGMQFNTTGNALFILDNGSKAVYEFSLSTPYTLSTLSYNNKFLDLSLIPSSVISAMALNDIGTEMYIYGFNSGVIYQYTLSSPFDIETATSTGTYSVSNPFGGFQDFVVTNDGNKLFTVGDRDFIEEFIFDIPFDITTLTYSGNNYPTHLQDENMTCIHFNNTGTKLHLVGFSNNKVYQYSLETPYDLSTISYDIIEFNYIEISRTFQSIDFNNIGDKLFRLDMVDDEIYEYSINPGEGGDQIPLNFSSSITWSEGSAPTFSSGSQKDWFNFTSIDQGQNWFGEVILQGF